jgi:hypothetical protein
MSPYGKPSASRVFHQLPPTSYDSGVGSKISVHHIDRSTCSQALVGFLHRTLDAELDRGLTYPHVGEYHVY